MILSNGVRFCFSLWLVKASVLSSSAKEVPRLTVCGIPGICCWISHTSDNHHHGTRPLARPMQGHPLPLLPSYSTSFHVSLDLLLEVLWGHVEVLFWHGWLGPASSTATIAAAAQTAAKIAASQEANDDKQGLWKTEAEQNRGEGRWGLGEPEKSGV